MRFFGHIAFADEMPKGRTLCGRPARKPRAPARFYCGKCVKAAVEHHNKARGTFYTYTFKAPTGGGGAA